MRCTIGADLAIPRAELPPSLLTELKHLASLHNPLFYERQQLRLSTHQTPRLIRCYEEDLTHLHLPRGLLQQLEDAVESAGSRLVIDDRRPTHAAAAARVSRPANAAASRRAVAMLTHDDGVLVAPPGTRKDSDRLRADRGTEASDADPRPQQAAARPVAGAASGATRPYVQANRPERRRQAQADRGRRPRDDPEPQSDRRSRRVLRRLRPDRDRRVPPPARCLVRVVRSAGAGTPFPRPHRNPVQKRRAAGDHHHAVRADPPSDREKRRPVPAISRSNSSARDRARDRMASETPIQEVFRLLVENEARTALVCNDVDRSAEPRADAASFSANGRSTAMRSPTGFAPEASRRLFSKGAWASAPAPRSSSRSRRSPPESNS